MGGQTEKVRKRSKLWKKADQRDTMEDNNLESKTTMVNDGSTNVFQQRKTN